MTLARSVLLLIVLMPGFAYGADQQPQATTSDTNLSAALASPHRVLRFTGMRVNQDLKPAPRSAIHADLVRIAPDALKAMSCLKLRTYQVRGQETLSDNESAFVSYSTCQPVTNYQVRSAVQTVQAPAH